MAVLAVQKLSGGAPTLGTGVLNYAGLTPAAQVAAGAGGDEFDNDGRTWVEVTNGGGGSINVTVDQVNPDSQGRVLDPVIAVGAAVTKRFGPFEKTLFDDANGRVKLSYSGVSSVTVGVFKLAERFSG